MKAILIFSLACAVLTLCARAGSADIAVKAAAQRMKPRRDREGKEWVWDGFWFGLAGFMGIS